MLLPAYLLWLQIVFRSLLFVIFTLHPILQKILYIIIDLVSDACLDIGSFKMIHFYEQKNF